MGSRGQRDTTWGLVSFALFLALAGCGKSQYLQQAPPPPAAPAVLSVSDGPIYDFGVKQVATVTPHAFTVSNTGGKDATAMTGSFYLSVSFSFEGGTYPGTGGTCGASLAPGATCTVVVDFVPAYLATFDDSIHVSYFDGTSRQTTSSPELLGKSQ